LPFWQNPTSTEIDKSGAILRQVFGSFIPAKWFADVARRKAFYSCSKDAAQLRLAIRRPNESGFGSKEKKMSRIVLSPKTAKLMKLCELEVLQARRRAKATGETGAPMKF
jgi:hypothetical protein